MIKELEGAATPYPEEFPDAKSRSAWFNPKIQGAVFQTIMAKQAVGPFLELGTWTGAGSTSFVAKRFPSKQIICVDTWEGSPEHHRIPAYNRVRKNLWDHFCSNTWHFRHRVTPLKMTTVEGMQAVANSGIKPELIYIDAAHEKEAVYEDVTTALKLFPDSAICGDDYTTGPKSHPGVRMAIVDCIEEGIIDEKELGILGHCWYLKRNWRR